MHEKMYSLLSSRKFLCYIETCLKWENFKSLGILLQAGLLIYFHGGTERHGIEFPDRKMSSEPLYCTFIFYKKRSIM
jgi:hypothetical protein